MEHTFTVDVVNRQYHSQPNRRHFELVAADSAFDGGRRREPPHMQFPTLGECCAAHRRDLRNNLWGRSGHGSGAIYAAALEILSVKLIIVCFSWESHSSAIVITSVSSRLKSTLRKFFCKVLNMLT